MPPQIRDLLTSLNQLTVASVSQVPFVVPWEDPRGPAFFFEQATAERYTQLPILRDRSIRRIVETAALANVTEWDSAPDGRRIEVEDLVARDAPLFSVLHRLEDRPLLLSLGPNGVDGVLTIYDLNMPAAHMFALGLTLIVENEIASAISLSLENQRAVESHVTSILTRKNKQVQQWEKAVAGGEQVEILHYLTFFEKSRCLTDRAVLLLASAAGVTPEDLKLQLREVRQLRNQIAHYSVFELNDYRTVVPRMRRLYRLATKLAASA